MLSGRSETCRDRSCNGSTVWGVVHFVMQSESFADRRTESELEDLYRREWAPLVRTAVVLVGSMAQAIDAFLAKRLATAGPGK